MRRQMMERETIWKDEAPPSTAMRNKKNIKRKKKLNTPKPSVLLCLVGRGGGLSVISPPPLSPSLSATGQVFFFLFCSYSKQDATFSSDELQPSGHPAVRRGTAAADVQETRSVEPKDTLLSERREARRPQLWSCALLSSLPLWRGGGRRARDAQREGGRCGGGSLCRTVNQRQAAVDKKNVFCLFFEAVAPSVAALHSVSKIKNKNLSFLTEIHWDWFFFLY